MAAGQALRFPKIEPEQEAVLAPCEHRVVSKTGRILCSKITEGDNLVSPELCRSCPFAAIDCSHLRFSLRQTSSSPLIVRFNGREEIWDDHPPQILFEQAACAVKVAPISGPEECVGCSLRCPTSQPEVADVQESAPRSVRPPVGPAKPAVGENVVPFPLSVSRRAVG